MPISSGCEPATASRDILPKNHTKKMGASIGALLLCAPTKHTLPRRRKGLAFPDVNVHQLEKLSAAKCAVALTRASIVVSGDFLRRLTKTTSPSRFHPWSN